MGQPPPTAAPAPARVRVAYQREMLQQQHQQQQQLRFESTATRPEKDHTAPQQHDSVLQFNIPKRLRQKVISASDAVSLVRDGDTVCTSGFVSQGVPEAVLKALGERYETTGSPNNLTLLFGSGPGDWNDRGLNHLAKTKEVALEGAASTDSNSTPVPPPPPMLRRAIGSHYGPVPKVAELALRNQVEAWTLPLGSISRLTRAQATHSPGHITTVGLGTYMDPDISGGAANEAAKQSKLHKKLISRIQIDGRDQLLYKALPINVAIIRGTTADSQGNITCEQESLLCDQWNIAAAARNSGGIVIAQVKRLAANGSLRSRDIIVPGALVDCVVVVNDQDHAALHPMSFEEEGRHNPVLTGEIVTPLDEITHMPLDIRKIIARSAFFQLQPNTIVNLGIGLPEGLAGVAAEEGMLEYVTLTTEPGVFGGEPASGRSFGPSYNASSVLEMNQMFDFYDGGGLDRCFLGAGQISPNGDVNVSRMSKDTLNGPGGFIDISQSTGKITFMAPFTSTKGLELSIPGDGTLRISKEGEVRKFVSELFETTFSGDEAVRRGQTVTYVTERAVFRRTAKHTVIELVEIAPGINLQRDILDQMDFLPAISPTLKLMEPRIFMQPKMNVVSELFGTLEDRCKYHEKDHTMFLELFGITINKEEDIHWMVDSLRNIIEPLVRAKNGRKIEMIVNYDGFDVCKGLEDLYGKAKMELQREYYRDVKRFASKKAFHRAASLGRTQDLRVSDWDPAELYESFDVNHDGTLSLEELRHGFATLFQIHLTPADLECFRATTAGECMVDGGTQQPGAKPWCTNKESFERGVMEVLKSTN